MKRLFWIISIFLVFSLFTCPTLAQGSIKAQTTLDDTLNARSGPGTGYAVLAELAPGTMVEVTARGMRGWVKVQIADGSVGGWVNAYYLVFQDGFTVDDVPLASGDAEGPLRGTVTSAVNLRGGPGTSYPVLTSIAFGTVFMLDGRDEGGYWMLGTVEGSDLRGWLSASFLRIEGSEAGLEVKDEIVASEAPLVDMAPAAASQTAVQQNAINIGESWRYPELKPTISSRMRTVYLRGQKLGNSRFSFAKVGDCMTVDSKFLEPILDPGINLGPYQHLEPTIRHFGNWYVRDSIAASVGFNSGGVLYADWADPTVCEPGESALACEYRLIKPSIALIMLGTQDVITTSAHEFESYMRQVIEFSTEQGVIPVISTLPRQLNSMTEFVTVPELNAIIRRLTREYGVPLWDFAIVLEPVPDHGITGEGRHLNDEGFFVRNLTALQMLHATLTKAMY